MKEYDLIKVIKEVVDDQLCIIGDDTAIIHEDNLVLTCDTLVEGVHFRLNTTNAFDLGYKAGAVNLSDIAAAGGLSKYFLVSLAIPKEISKDFIKEFYTGLKAVADQFNTFIVGGDLAKSDKIVITITAIAKKNGDIRRSFALPAQKILATGDFGASFAGLQLLENKLPELAKDIPLDIKQKFMSRHLKPYPRINEARYLVKNLNYKQYCFMDTSDGLADAVYQISQKSNKRIKLYIDKIPVDNNIKIIAKSLNYSSEDIALFGGEDFELLFSCYDRDIPTLLSDNEFKFTEIGEVLEGPAGVDLVYYDKIIELTEALLEEKISFKHF